jgi:negative regulator of flagellin synthesis FlgM
MKIDETLSAAKGVQSVNRVQAGAEASASAVRPESVSTAHSGGGDSATLSAGATLASQLANTSDVRTEKVASVQQALASGTYLVDAGKVADKMIASMLQKP